MTITSRSTPTFAAVSFAEGHDGVVKVARAIRPTGGRLPVLICRPGLHIAIDGLTAEPFVAPANGKDATLTLNIGARVDDSVADATAMRELLSRADNTRLERFLPPFAAVGLASDNRTLLVSADWLGFRQIYYAEGLGWAAVATSAYALAALDARGIDREGIAAQSLLGWQIGLSTPFDGVRKLPPGALLSLRGGRAELTQAPRREPTDPPEAGDASRASAQILRRYLAAYLDDHPDAVLQLTGGLDSRVLLGAIPLARRRGLRAMTLDLGGSADARIATELAGRFSMRHAILTLDGLDRLGPEATHALCATAARRLDCSADPIAAASLGWAEATFDQGPRLSGLGGEIVRGFYYFGSARSRPVTRARVERLARWRLFPNGSVPSEVLTPTFARWAHASTLARIQMLMEASQRDWLASTDEFYLGQRMHRWAGVLATSTCFDRPTTNPMLDHRFVCAAGSQPPRLKRNMRLLSQIMIELDPELAAIPLNGRPAPAAYALPGIARSARAGAASARKATAKARQRARRQRRPPPGATVIADKVVEHWRRDPDSLDSVRALEIFRPAFLDQLLRGDARADPATIALLVNLEVAASAADGTHASSAATSSAAPSRRAN